MGIVVVSQFYATMRSTFLSGTEGHTSKGTYMLLLQGAKLPFFSKSLLMIFFSKSVNSLYLLLAKQ